MSTRDIAGPAEPLEPGDPLPNDGDDGDDERDGDGLLVSTVPVSLGGERVDRVVALLTGLPRAEVSRLVSSGAIALDATPVTSRHRRVVAGELLEIAVPARVAPERFEPGDASGIVFGVVYEDASIIVVDKPAGLVVHPGAGHRDDTLAAGLVHRYPDLARAAEHGAGEPLRPGIVHRLDKDTSGLLVVARTPEAYVALVEQLATRTMGRTYRALALGAVASEEGVIEAPVGRSERDPTRMAVTVRGREARTRYRVLERFTNPLESTLLEVNLDTGRTHQIRVHLAAIGHPVLGDARYGGGKRGVAGPRPFLHAERLRLVHPRSGAELEFASPLPADLVAVLATFS